MTLLDQTKSLCQKYNLKPSRSKGQNFLISEAAYEAMIEVAEIKKTDTVLEVGPGLGYLTERLASRAQKVLAVELDDTLAFILKKRLRESDIKNVAIFNEDILNFTGQWVTDAREAGDKLTVVANLPYNLTSFFLRKFIAGNEGNIKPTRLTLLLQKEVGERMAAESGRMSLLAVSIQFYTEITLQDFIPAKDFWPVPQVGSMIVSLQRSNYYLSQLLDLNLTERDFFRIVKIGFSARRKMLSANLRSGLRIPKETILDAFKRTNLKETVRAQELSIEDWLKLIATLKKYMV